MILCNNDNDNDSDINININININLNSNININLNINSNINININSSISISTNSPSGVARPPDSPPPPPRRLPVQRLHSPSYCSLLTKFFFQSDFLSRDFTRPFFCPRCPVALSHCHYLPSSLFIFDSNCLAFSWPTSMVTV